MKKILLFVLLASMSMFFMIQCGGTPPPEPETAPVVVEPEPEPEPVPEPEPEPEPEVIPVTDGDFKTVYFDFDKYNLVDSAKMALEYNARIMGERTTVMVKLEGHCDDRGTVEYNLSLGDKRANSVRDYLSELGVEVGRMETISYGKSRPVDTGANEGAWAKNRRVEFRILSQ